MAATVIEHPTKRSYPSKILGTPTLESYCNVSELRRQHVLSETNNITQVYQKTQSVARFLKLSATYFSFSTRTFVK